MGRGQRRRRRLLRAADFYVGERYRTIGTVDYDGPLADGCYPYVMTATDGTSNFTGNGKVFVNR
jgi:hypothetical protein